MKNKSWVGEAMKFWGITWALAVVFLLNSSALYTQEQKKENTWTRLYYKLLNNNENQGKSELYFAKEDIPLFTQLIFSWNAVRPQKGHFSFWVSARDAKTKKWGTWHRMVDWGAGVQRSYLSKKGDHFSQYHHVRLEINEDTASDAFKVRIARNQGADFSALKAFAVSLSNFNAFESEDSRNWSHLHSVHVSGVPRVSQFELDHPKNDTLCSPTSCTMLAGFLSESHVDPIQFAQQVYDEGLDAFGSWPFNVANLYEICQGSFLFFTARLNSFDRLHNRLKQGTPVVVSVRGPLDGAAGAYRHGHLLVVVGWDAKKQEVIVHDPAFKKNAEVTKRYSIKDFVIAWERSRRLAYIVEPREQRG